MKIVKVSKEELEKQVKELSNEDLDKAAGGLHLCPPKCHKVNNRCVCDDDEDDE